MRPGVLPLSRYCFTERCISVSDHLVSTLYAAGGQFISDVSRITECPEARCFECPENSKCEGVTVSYSDAFEHEFRGINLLTLEAKPGFWRATDASTTFHPCPLGTAVCVGRVIEAINTSINVTEVKDGKLNDLGNDLFGNHMRPRGRRDSQCPPQNKGLLCSVCEDKHIMKPGSKVCGTCAKYEGEISLLIAFTVMALAVAFLVKMRAYIERKYFDSPDEAERVIRAAVQRRSVPLRTCAWVEH